MMVKKNLPSPVGVYLPAGERPGQDAQADPVLVQFVGDGQDFLDRPATAVELPHHEGVAAAEVLQGRGQSRPVGLAAGDLVLEELDAPGFAQRVALQLRVLRLGAHPQVRDEVAVSRRHRRTISITVAQESISARTFRDGL